jgi:predicted AAA+ superfamily ATPase
VQNYKNFLGKNKILIIDEAQRIENIGNILKLMVDEIPYLRILISGSSALNMITEIAEPLTGRMRTFHLYPFSESEYHEIENPLQRKDNLNQRLIYGNYPEIVQINDDHERSEYLQELVNTYLLKDILSFENIRNSSKLYNLLKLIAFQVGSRVSNQELGAQLSISKNTVERYLDLLSKSFVLFKLTGFSRNLRKEVSKNSKWYFCDNGIRNTFIANLNPVELRNDIGILWENYIISERLKYQKYNKLLVNNYFWRTYDRQEIDWIEERGGKLYAYEFKWNPKKIKIPASWQKSYPLSEYRVISHDNYLEWLV